MCATENKPTIGVVGCGYWGPNLIRNFQSIQECILKSVCDADEDRLALVSANFPAVETHTSYDIFLEDPDLNAVVIAVPVQHHYKMAYKSLMAGKHTFIEKPMASSIEECKSLIELAENKQLTLMVGHTFLYSPAIRKIKEIIDSGELGKIHYISSRRLNLGLYQKDINVVWDLAPHDISIILYLMGKYPSEINCRGKTTCSTKMPDVSNMTLTFADEGFATIHSSWLDPRKVRDMAIVGENKMLVYDDLQDHEKIKIYDMRVDPQVLPNESRVAYHYGDMWAPYIVPAEPLRLECAHFIDCIVTGQRPLSDGGNGLAVVKILSLASDSMQNSGNNMIVRNGKPNCGELYIKTGAYE
jgi:predicted dehydrogenase